MSIEVRLPRHKTLSTQVDFLLGEVLDQDRIEALETLTKLYSASKPGKERRALRAFIISLTALGPKDTSEPEPVEEPELEDVPEIIPEPEPEPEPAPPPKPAKKPKETAMMSLDLSDAAMMLQFGGGDEEVTEEPTPPEIEAEIEAEIAPELAAEAEAETETETETEEPTAQSPEVQAEFTSLPDPVEIDASEANLVETVDQDVPQVGEPSSDTAEIEMAEAAPELAEPNPFETMAELDENTADLTDSSEAQTVVEDEPTNAIVESPTEAKPKPKKKNAAIQLEDNSALFAELGPGFSDE